MEPSQREIILKNLEFLVQNTSDEAFENLLEKFSSNHGLSPYMLQKIKKGTSSIEMKRKFYEMVPKRGPQAFRKLCDCLYSVGLKSLAEKLKESRLFLDGSFCAKLNGSSGEKNNEVRYTIKSNPKGHVLIINIMNYIYNPQQYRAGSEKDVESLKELWNKLGYSTKIYQDLKSGEFMKVIDDFIDLTKSDMLDSVFVFIMTHGVRDSMNQREVKLQMSDSAFVNSEWILKRFTSIHSKHLADIPKVIFIQACRGEDRDLGYWLENDSSRDNLDYNNDIDAVKMALPKPHFSNLLVVFSTLPGFVSKRNTDTGAPFIQELCRIIKAKSKNTHLIDMIDEVNRNLKEDVINNWKVKGEYTFFQTVHYENWRFSSKLYI